MQAFVNLKLEGKRGTKYEVILSHESQTGSVFIHLVQRMTDGTARDLAGGISPKGGVDGNLLAGWFAEEGK